MTDRIYVVLFLCTGDQRPFSHRRVPFCAGIGEGRFRSFSAGSQPKGRIDPFALKVLAKFGCPTGGMRSKSSTEFVAPDAPVIGFVSAVCDSAAGESCPMWPGRAEMAER